MLSQRALREEYDRRGRRPVPASRRQRARRRGGRCRRALGAGHPGAVSRIGGRGNRAGDGAGARRRHPPGARTELRGGAARRGARVSLPPRGRVPRVPRPALGAGVADRDLPLLPGARGGRGSPRSVDGAQALPDVRRGGRVGQGAVPGLPRAGPRPGRREARGAGCRRQLVRQPDHRRRGRAAGAARRRARRPGGDPQGSVPPAARAPGAESLRFDPRDAPPGGPRRPGPGADGRGPRDAAAPPGHAVRPGLHPARQGRALARGAARAATFTSRSPWPCPRGTTRGCAAPCRNSRRRSSRRRG